MQVAPSVDLAEFTEPWEGAADLLTPPGQACMTDGGKLVTGYVYRPGLSSPYV